MIAPMHRRLLHPISLLLAATLVTVALAGCVIPYPEGDEGSDSTTPTGNVAFFVKDAPADELSAFYVTFSHVEVHRAGDDGDDAQDDDSNTTEEPGNETEAPEGNETEEPGNETQEPANATDDADTDNETEDGDDDRRDWITIVNETHTVNLKNFTGDARAFLGNASVPEGKYTQIRIHVDESWGILEEDGSRVDVKVPSEALKIVRPWTVTANETTELTVDFLLEDSLIKAGQSGMWLFKPVMKLAIDHPAAADASDDAEDDEAGGPPDETRRGRADDAPGGPPDDEDEA